MTVMDTQKLVEDLYKKNNAYLEGHFVLSSGKHSDKYLQSALVLQNPQDAEVLGRYLADQFKNQEVTVVVSPAIGGLIIGHEVARALGARFIFTEKDADGKPILRRNFQLGPADKAIIIEDVVTTGLSAGEVKKIIDQTPATFVGMGCIVNRSGQPNPNLKHLMFLNVRTMDPENCELCKAGIPFTKPGSRK